jgi:hypothetical protein
MFTVKKKYDARITDAGLSTTKAGNTQAFVELSVKGDDGSLHQYTWYGNLSEKSQEFTASSLIKMGFLGNSFDDIKKGSIMFDGTKDRTVEFDWMQKKNEITGEYENTDKLKVKWVNLKSSGLTKFDGQTGINNQAALFAKVKAELGVKKTTTTTKPVPTDW